MNAAAGTKKFKEVTIENWLETDPIIAMMVNRDRRDGSTTPVNGTDFIKYVNDRPLSDRVPQDVREAYLFAVGGVGYAYFYYPMLTLVSQQISASRISRLTACSNNNHSRTPAPSSHASRNSKSQAFSTNIRPNNGTALDDFEIPQPIRTSSRTGVSQFRSN